MIGCSIGSVNTNSGSSPDVNVSIIDVTDSSVDVCTGVLVSDLVGTTAATGMNMASTSSTNVIGVHIHDISNTPFETTAVQHGDNRGVANIGAILEP